MSAKLLAINNLSGGALAKGCDSDAKGSARPESDLSIDFQQFGFYTRAQLENLCQPAWVIQDLLQEGTVALLFGREGIGKSFFALHAGLCIATGSPVLGQQTWEAGSFLYFLSEAPGWTNARIQAWEEWHRGVVDTTLLHSRFCLFAGPVLLNDLGQLTFRQTAAGNQTTDDLVTAAIIPRFSAPVRLIAVDILADSFASSGIHEDDASKVSHFIQKLRQFAKTIGKVQQTPPPAVLLIHHPTKRDDKTERGSGALRGNCDTVILCKGDTRHVALDVVKQKNGRRIQLSYRLHPLDVKRSGWLANGPYCVVVHNERGANLGGAEFPLGERETAALRNQLTLLTLLAGSDSGMSRAQWQTSSGLTKAPFDKAVSRNEKAGHSTKGSGKFSYWKITPAGRDFLAANQQHCDAS
jgi:hypothetical protein